LESILQFGWAWSAFVWGCIGAAAPEIYRFYKATHRKYDKFEIRWRYVAGSVVFILFAGFLTAGLFAPPDLAASFYTGFSMPVVIAAGLGQKESNS